MWGNILPAVADWINGWLLVMGVLALFGDLDRLFQLSSGSQTFHSPKLTKFVQFSPVWLNFASQCLIIFSIF